MAHYINKYFLIALFSALMFSACEKKWDERTGVNNQQLSVDLMQQIKANGNLSIFAGYLSSTGYDTVLASSKTFTVWAPTNASLQNLDPAIVNDPDKLRMFVQNHIANQAFFASDASSSLRVGTLSGKKVSFNGTKVDEAGISTADQYVKNGVLHIIDKPLEVRMSIDAFIRSLSTKGQMHKSYVLGRDTNYTDTSSATVIGYDSKGDPVLEPGTGLVSENRYYLRTRDLANEDSLFTYFVLTDAAFTAERAKFAPYFIAGSETETNLLTDFHVLKDLTVSGMVLPNALPDTLLSINGVKIPISAGAIEQSYLASNGIVYVMNSVDFVVKHKIAPIVIEGENPDFFSRNDFTARIRYRTRLDPDNQVFKDIMVQGANLPAQSFAGYILPGLYTTQYKVYRRALNDLGADLQPRVTFGSAGDIDRAASGTLNPVFTVTYPNTVLLRNDYSVRELTGATRGTWNSESTIDAVGGKLSVTKYAPINMYYQGRNHSNIDLNGFTLDYIILEPILK